MPLIRFTRSTTERHDVSATVPGSTLRKARRAFARSKSRGRKAFTLIELLVVIAIISILASILFPAFAGARERARQTSCLSNTKQLDTAFQMYSQDYDEGFPGAGGHGGNTVPCMGSPDDSWVRGEFLDTTVARTCAQSQLPVPNGAIYTYVKNTRVYICPSDVQGDDRTLSYAMNSNLSEQALALVREPSSCILLLDEDNGKTNGIDDGYFAAPTSDAATGGPNYDPNDKPGTRHLGGANIAYVDGHSKWAKPTQIKTANFDPSNNN